MAEALLAQVQHYRCNQPCLIRIGRIRKRMKPRVILGTLAAIAMSFALGVLWEKHRIIQRSPMELTGPLLLSTEAGGSGQLPKGTILYPYSEGPSTDMYIVFVNTKNRNVLKPKSFDHYLTIAPIDGYEVVADAVP